MPAPTSGEQSVLRDLPCQVPTLLVDNWGVVVPCNLVQLVSLGNSLTCVIFTYVHACNCT